MAWDGEAGFRPPTDRITSPALRGRLESAGARTTRMPSLVPKYSPKSGLRLTRSRSPQGEPKNSKFMSGILGMTMVCGIVISGISTRKLEPRSSATRVAFFVSPPRRYSTCAVSPGSSLRASSTSLAPGPDSSSSSVLAPASNAAPMTIHFRCITRCSFGASEPHVSGASDVNGHELLHRVHPLLPQFHEFGAAHGSFGRPYLRQLAVDDGDAIFQRGRERRRAAARDPRGGVVALELRLERRGLLLHPLQLSGVDTPARARPDQEQQRDARRRRQAPRSPPAPAAALLDPERVAHRRPPVPGRPVHRQRFERRDALVQHLELGPARRARLVVLLGPGRRLAFLEGQQVIHRAMHHRAAPSASSIRRSRVCARASCDFEKLTVLPISSAISSCV